MVTDCEEVSGLVDRVLDFGSNGRCFETLVVSSSNLHWYWTGKRPDMTEKC